MVRVPTSRAPTHPGEMLSLEFLKPMDITQRDLADAIHVPYQRINEIVNGKRGITPSTALRLAKYFGMSADFWLNLQQRWDLYYAIQAEKQELDTIQQHGSS
jgi:antitoxin HigA-1